MHLSANSPGSKLKIFSYSVGNNNIYLAADLSGLIVRTERNYRLIVTIRPNNNDRTAEKETTKSEVVKPQSLIKALGFGFYTDHFRGFHMVSGSTVRPSKEVNDLILEKIAEKDIKLSSFYMLREQLTAPASACHGDNRPIWLILDALPEKRLKEGR